MTFSPVGPDICHRQRPTDPTRTTPMSPLSIPCIRANRAVLFPLARLPIANAGVILCRFGIFHEEALEPCPTRNRHPVMISTQTPANRKLLTKIVSKKELGLRYPVTTGSVSATGYRHLHQRHLLNRVKVMPRACPLLLEEAGVLVCSSCSSGIAH